ncbi:MAG: transposase [Actinomycetota bacterium]
MTTTVTTLPARADAGAVSTRPPDPEVPEKPKRRRFTTEYKQRILAEADALPEGGIGALLRREGLYWSHLVDWRRQRAGGTLGTARPGRPARDPKDVELEALRAENERLRQRVEQAEAVIDVQKKLSRLLGIDSETTRRGGRS